MVDIKFSEENQIHPWKDKTRAEEWMQEQVLNASVRTKDAEVKKILFRGGSRQMLVYVDDLSNEAATDVLVPRIQSLLSPTER